MSFENLVREEMDRRDWSQRRLADKTLLGEATIARLLKGKYSRKTRRKVADALEITEEPDVAVSQEVAKACYGGYIMAHWPHYPGSYIYVRPSFTDETKFVVSQFTIEWSPERQALVFHDSIHRHAQSGIILMPPGAPYFHFLTQDDAGSARLINAYHTYRYEDPIRGMLLTCANPSGNILNPATAPVVMRRLTEETGEWSSLSGLMDRDEPLLSQFVDDLSEHSIQPSILN